MENSPKPRRLTARRLLLLGAAVVAALLIVLLIIRGYSAEWTGLPGKTIWDWLQLLIVPVVIAGGGYWFNWQQRKRDVEIANQRAQDTALQAYLDQMTQLLVTEDVHKLLSDYRTRELIHARTLHVLEQLDLEQLNKKCRGALRKGALLRFLYKTKLILGKPPQSLPPPPSILFRADLKGANLKEPFNLEGAYLRGADLAGARLMYARLGDAHLKCANLSGADLRRADLSYADLSTDVDDQGCDPVNLSGAILCRANLAGANLSGANLARANLRGANLGLVPAKNRGAEYPQNTVLQNAILVKADLRDTNFTGADLRGANLKNASGLTDEQLGKCVSLQGAIMPDGSKHT